MKKLLAVIVVLAITLISSVALAEVAVSGSIETRGRAFNNLDHNGDVADYDRDTQTRVRVNLDGKAGDAKAKITIEKDYQTWGGVEAVNGPLSEIREAWIDTGLFGPVRLKGGHMLAALGNAWFVRSMKYGSDAWIAYADIGPMHLGLVDVKIADIAKDADADLYSAVVTAKMADTMTVGGQLTRIIWSKPAGVIGSDVTNNLGVHTALVLGPVNLKAEVDLQMGTDHTSCALGKCSEYKGNQIVIEGGLVAGPANVSFSVGRGTGRQTEAVLGSTTTRANKLNTNEIVVVQDADPHTSFLYEYKFGQPGINGAGAHAAYQNLTALSAGADVKLGSLTVGGTFWWLMATEDLTLYNGLTGPGGIALVKEESDLGMEVDVRVNWKLSDAVSWNTTLGYFIPGSAYDPVVNIPTIGNVVQSADESTGIQSVLSMKF